MKYNREWLGDIRMTEELIRTTPLNDVPIQFRPLITQQFNVQVMHFKSDLASGLDTSKSQVNILDLSLLVHELIAEEEKQRNLHAA